MSSHEPWRQRQERAVGFWSTARQVCQTAPPMLSLLHGPTKLRWAIVASVLLLPAVASASSVLETIGAPGAGNGLTARTLSRGAEATYYNPALLPEVTPNVTLGTMVLGESSDIHLAARPTGLDIPTSVLDADLNRSASMQGRLWPQATSALPNQRTDTSNREVSAYVALGLVRPLIAKTLVLGFYALVPTSGFLRQDSFFSDEREQYFSNQLHFELLGDRLKTPTISGALGWRVMKELSLGVGLDLGMATQIGMRAYIPNAANQSNLLIVPHLETKVAAAPHFGATLRLLDRLAVMATLHLPKSWDIHGENRIRYWDYVYPDGQNAVIQNFASTQGSEPTRIGLGVRTGGSYGKTEWQLGLQGVWTAWSRYRDRHGERPLDPWHDTVTVGLGWAIEREKRRLSAELGLQPSPVPNQLGKTNYVDNTRLGMSLGLELPLSLGETDYALGLFLQSQFLVPRQVTKTSAAAHPVLDELADDAVDRIHGAPLSGASGFQTNNPGYPGFRSSGTLLGASMVVKVLR